MQLEPGPDRLRPAAAAERLRGLFGARSVALVGATDRSLWSLYTYQNLQRFSPGVGVHVVHPHHREVHGQRCAPSLAAIGEPVDLAYVMVPTPAVLEVVDQAADAGIANIVVLTAGFAETGPDGAAREAELVALAGRRGLCLLGPNGNGFVNVAGGVTPYGLPITAPLDAGPVGIVLQSGGLASAVLAAAQAGGIGVSLLCSTGNEALTSATDIISYLVADDHTRVIAAFVESIRQPEAFKEVALAALAAGKPIVALKTGRSEAGARAALAHTGALAGDDRVVDAALRQFGVVRVDSLEEMLATAGYLGYHPGIRGRRIAAVTASGGACDLLADRASAEGLELPEFASSTLDDLRRCLPEFSNPHNPLDVTGYVVVDPKLSLEALGVVGRDAPGRYDLVVYSISVPRAAPGDPGPVEARMDAVAAASAEFGVPVVLQGAISADLTPFARRLLGERGLYVLAGIELGTRAIGHGARYHERRDAILGAGPPPPAAVVDPPGDARGVWPEHRVRPLLEAAGIPVVPARLARSAADAEAAAIAIGGPVAMKVASAGLAHKSDVGGVRLGVDASAAAGVYRELAARLADARPGAVLDGVLVAPMRPGGVELLVGVVTDPTWGKVLSVGLGGVWVEVLADVSLRVLPVGEDEIARMLAELRAAPLLRGGRGTHPVDLDAVVATIAALGRLAEGLGPALDTLEINPLRVDGEQIEVLDALAVWAPTAERGPTPAGADTRRTGWT